MIALKNTKRNQQDAGALHCTKLTVSHEVLKYIGENSNKIPLHRLKKESFKLKKGQNENSHQFPGVLVRYSVS